jgi:hypothetical protein
LPMRMVNDFLVVTTIFKEMKFDQKAL